MGRWFRSGRRQRATGAVVCTAWAVLVAVSALTAPASGAQRRGNHIAYANPNTGAIHVVDLSGRHRARLTPLDVDREASTPEWSPNGTQIAYTSSFDMDAYGDLWVMRADGSHKHRVLRGGYLRSLLDLGWAPGGGRIAVALHDYDGTFTDLGVLYLKTGRLVRLHALSKVWTPYDVDWSPDGTRLIFSAARASDDPESFGNIELFTIRPNGSELHRLTSTPSILEYGPKWSPTGARIAYSRITKACETSVVIAHADATNARRVPLGCAASAPDWAPGGGRLVVNLDGPNHGNNVVLTRLDGTHRTVVARGYDPAWQPN